MACCTTLGKIEKECGGGNKAGLKQVFYITCTDQVTAIPAPDADTHEITDDLTMRAAVTGPPAVAAGKFYDIAISRFDASLVSEPQGDAENVSYLNTMTVFINKQSPEKAYILNGFLGGEYIVIVADGNGQKQLLGELDNGAAVTVRPQTNDKNGYVVTVTWESSHLPYFYSGAISLAA